MQVLPHGAEVQRGVGVGVRDAEAAAEVEVAHRVGQLLGEVEQEVDRAPLRLDEDLGAEVLRAGEEVEAEEVEVELGDPVEQRRHLLGVDAELLGAAAHAHAGAAHGEVGVDPDRHPRADAEVLARRRRVVGLPGRLDLDQDARRRPPGAARPGVLPGPAKLTSAGLTPVSSADLHLAAPRRRRSRRPGGRGAGRRAGIGLALTA